MINFTPKSINSTNNLTASQINQQLQFDAVSCRPNYYQTMPLQLEHLTLRLLKSKQFQANICSSEVEAYFLKRKQDLDQVVYSLIRTKDLELANNLYHQILEKKATFADLAQQYSQGAEANSGGCLGPVAINQIHPVIRRILALSHPNQLWYPQAIEGWFVIVRLEEFLPASLTEALQQRLINELFELWLQET